MQLPTEILALVSELAPMPTVFRHIQLAHTRMLVNSQQQFLARCWWRELRYESNMYYLILPSDRLDGPCIGLYSDGAFWRYRYYSYGHLHGAYLEWYRYSNAHTWQQPSIRDAYVNDKRHGEYLSWYVNGQLGVHGARVDGKPHGVWEYWRSNGLPLQQEEYVNGVIIKSVREGQYDDLD